MHIIKRVFKVVSIIIFLLIATFIVINLFDADPHPGLYTLKDIPPQDFDSSNGYYIVWGLCEPENVDVRSEEFTRPFREYLDTPEGQLYNKKATDFPWSDYRKGFPSYKGIIRRIEFPPRLFEENWFQVLETKWKDVRKAREECRVPLARYRDLIDAPFYNDFTSFDTVVYFPDLLAYINFAKLYNAIQLMEAREGKWQESVERLLRHMEAGKRAVKGGRTLLSNMVAKAVVSYSLEALLAVMNHPECPDTVYRTILDGMPPLTYQEYGSRNAFIGEYLMDESMVTFLDDHLIEEEGSRWMRLLPSNVFFQKNRTLNYYYDHFSALIAFDEQEPYLWQGSPKDVNEESKKIEKFMWWVRNPIGKMTFSIGVPNLWVSIVKNYRLRAHYEQVRILAELHLEYKPGEKVGDVLKRLESYKSHDPFSGKPYLWNPKKQLLYSVGLDGEDNGGDYKHKVDKGIFKDVDFSVPVVIHNPVGD